MIEKCLVSACLVGLCTRYDGQSKAHAKCLSQLEGLHWIPVCPEQLGGLPTPRPPARLINGDGHDVLDGKAQVLDRQGRDVSAQFIRGARMVLAIARAQGIELCLLKSKSPSCGLAHSIDGTGLTGVTAALLAREGLRLLSF